jgi:hypothetical protein
MITLTREEAQQVLDALEEAQSYMSCETWSPSMTDELLKLEKTLRARLAQPEPEPVAWTVGGLITDFSRDFSAYKTKTYTKPLYTTPPQPEPELVADKYLMEVECTKCGAKQDGVLTVTAPPQREWQGLTDEEMFNCLAQTDGEAKRLPLGFKWFAEAIEAKLKEKNT